MAESAVCLCGINLSLVSCGLGIVPVKWLNFILQRNVWWRLHLVHFRKLAPWCRTTCSLSQCIQKCIHWRSNSIHCVYCWPLSTATCNLKWYLNICSPGQYFTSVTDVLVMKDGIWCKTGILVAGYLSTRPSWRLFSVLHLDVCHSLQPHLHSLALFHRIWRTQTLHFDTTSWMMCNLHLHCIVAIPVLHLRMICL